MEQLSQVSTKHELIDGYTHISVAVDKANKKLQDIRSGLLKPILTSSKKETDKIGGLYEGDQMVIAGRTGTGKTAKIVHMIEDFVNPKINPEFAEDGMILFDSWEMSDWRNVLRMYSRLNELPVKTILDSQRQMQQDAFDRIMLLSNKFRNHPIYFSNISQKVGDWRDTKYRIRDKYPNKKIINVVDHTRLVVKSNESSEEALITSLMATGMKLKLERNFINIFLSQMNRAIETAGLRSEIGKNLPVSSDIFGSDGVFQYADIVVASHRPGFYGLKKFDKYDTGTMINGEFQDNLLIDVVLKQRDGWTGPLVKRHNLAINHIEDYD